MSPPEMVSYCKSDGVMSLKIFIQKKLNFHSVKINKSFENQITQVSHF